jgi:hypothetical protein
MAVSLSLEKIEEMWRAFQERPTAEHVSKVCGVSWHTADKYIKKENWHQRLQEIQKKAMKLMDADAAQKLAKILSLVESRIESAFNFDVDGNPIPKFAIENSKDLNDTIRLALELIGEPKCQEVEHRGEIKIIRVKSSGE